MELEVNSEAVAVETVEVVAGSDDGTAAALMGQPLIATNAQDLIVPSPEHSLAGQTLEVTGSGLSVAGLPSASQPSIITLPIEPSPSLSQAVQIGTKRTSTEVSMSDLPPVMTTQSSASFAADLPRKKSRNYLDSHKNIEKKRRDRINLCLNQLKSLVPDCRQYGNKKLDKAEILEMTIEFIQQFQQGSAGGGKGGAGQLDLALGQKEWASDLTTWIIQNKILHTGPHALENFCQALLMHLQTFGSGSSLSSATSLLINQASGGEDDPLLRQQVQLANQVSLLQQLTSQAAGQPPSGPGEVKSASSTDSVSSGGNAVTSTATQGGGAPTIAQTQLTQLHALLLLQQQQQLLTQQSQEGGTDSQSQAAQIQQLQQLQQLQALLLQHIANEATQQGKTAPTNDTAATLAPASNPASIQGDSSMLTSITNEVATSTVDQVSSTVAAPPVSLSTGPPSTAMDLSLKTPETEVLEQADMYALEGSLDNNHLLQVSVTMAEPEPASQSAVVSTVAPGQMWSGGGADRPEQLMPPDVQEEVSLLDEQTQ